MGHVAATHLYLVLRLRMSEAVLFSYSLAALLYLPHFFRPFKLLNMSDPELFLCRCQELTHSGSPANVDVVCGEASREGGATDAAREGHQPTAR
jgi:hypothetical protein